MSKTYAIAIRDVVPEMRRDENVFIMGEDIEILGNIWLHQSLLRNLVLNVENTPISEAGFIGAGLGAARRYAAHCQRYMDFTLCDGPNYQPSG